MWFFWGWGKWADYPGTLKSADSGTQKILIQGFWFGLVWFVADQWTDNEPAAFLFVSTPYLIGFHMSSRGTY